MGSLSLTPASALKRPLLALLMSIVSTATTGAAWVEQVPPDPRTPEAAIDLSFASGGLTGHYRGSVKQVLEALGRVMPLTYAASPTALAEPIAGTLEGASLSDALRQMLPAVNFVLDQDPESGNAHVYLLNRLPGSDQAPGPWSATAGSGLDPRTPPGSGLENLSPELRAQFEVANQHRPLPPELEAQFAVAHQETRLSPELQAQFDVAHQQAGPPPEVAAQFEVAHQHPVLAPELQAQFDLAKGNTGTPPRWSPMSAPLPVPGAQGSTPPSGVAAGDAAPATPKMNPRGSE